MLGPAHAQQGTATSPTKIVTSIETIEIGMPGDLVIAGLTKEGLSLKDDFGGGRDAEAQHWTVSNKAGVVGEFSIEKGRISSAEVQIYPRAGNSEAVDLGDALYWIFYDNGLLLKSEDRR